MGNAEYMGIIKYISTLFEKEKMEIDLLNQDPENEQGMHKLKKLVKTPDSFFMDVKCPQCHTVNTIFSNAQKVCLCTNCKYLLAVPRGGKTKLAVGTAWRRKGN